MSLLDRAIQIIKGGIAPLFLDLEKLNEFDEVFFAIFGERIKVCCGKTHQHYFDRLKKYIEMANQERKFLLNKDIQMHTNNNVYTSVNMTDELAIALLKQDKRRISNFERFPENWVELIEGETKPKKATKAK